MCVSVYGFVHMMPPEALDPLKLGSQAACELGGCWKRTQGLCKSSAYYILDCGAISPALLHTFIL